MSPTSFSRLASLLRKRRVDALLIDDPNDTFYLTRFPSTYLVILVTVRKTWLITDTRYKLALAARADLMKDCELVIRTDARVIERLCKTAKVRSVIVDAESTTLKSFDDLRKRLPDVKFTAESGLVKGLRVSKAADELLSIRRALAIAERSLSETLPLIRPGVSEREIRIELEDRFLRNGGDKPAFDTIIASGPNAAVPHARVSDRRVRNREMIIMDFGVSLDGYNCDITRTVFVGIPDRTYRLRYAAVRDAMISGEAAVRTGRECRRVDAVARKLLERRRLARYFTHSLGHGVGIQVHERPYLNPLSREILKKGMVVTVEPGIYIEGWGGIRIEDMVVAGDDETGTMTDFPSDLIVL